MNSAISVILRRGNSAITDGICFSNSDALESVRITAEQSGARFFPVYCSCPVDVAVRRVEEDIRQQRHVAMDRDAGLVRQVYENFCAISDDVPVIDTTKPPEIAGAQLITALNSYNLILN